MRVMSKANKYRPSVATEYFVRRNANGSITIMRDNVDGTVLTGSTFTVGDIAEYDSYNLSYIGIITKITDNTVTIVNRPGYPAARAHRLSMHVFCWRNAKFDADDTARRNSEEMMYL